MNRDNFIVNLVCCSSISTVWFLNWVEKWILIIWTCFWCNQSRATGVNSSWIGIVFSDFKNEWRAGDVNSVELNVDVVDTVLAGHEPHRVDVRINSRNETIVFNSRWWYNLVSMSLVKMFNSCLRDSFFFLKSRKWITLESKSPLAPFLRTINAWGLFTWQPASGNCPISILWASPCAGVM